MWLQRVGVTASLAVMFFINGLSWAGTYSGGNGIGKNPYQVGNANDWVELINTPDDWGMGFVLTADIDFEGQTISPVAPDTGPGYGFQGNKFTGTFSGGGFTLKNAVINQPDKDYVGVFGCVGTSGQLLNLRIKNVTVSGLSSVGVLAGENAGTIQGCQALGSVVSNGEYTGGLVGYNTGTIQFSAAQCSISGTGWHRGGLVGSFIGGTISNSYAVGAVGGTSGDAVGGLVGTFDGGTMIHCYSSCRVNASGDYVGGLIGQFVTGIVTDCYWDTALSGKHTSGGGAGVTGKTTAQMKQQATFAGWDFSGAPNSWQITENQHCPRIVSLLPAYSGGIGTSTTPYLIANPSDWLEMIYTASDYNNTFLLTADIDFNGQTLTPVAPDMQAKFTGSFDGQHQFVRNIVIAQPMQDVVGLFGYMGAAGSVQGLNIRDITVSGKQYVGGLAAYNQGQISECSITGSVQGTNFYIGGLVGWNENLVHKCFAKVDVTGSGYYIGGLVGANSNGTITQSCARGSVTGTDQYVGGLVGYNGGVTSSIGNCYATGHVTGNNNAGGLVGGNVCSISHSYATGYVSGSTRTHGGLVGFQDSNGSTFLSYWDTQTSGKTNSAGGAGKTTAEMLEQGTFFGWNWTSTWKPPHRNYPQLQWSVAMLTPDLNKSGVVGFDDLLLFVQHWLKDGCLYPDWCGGADLNAGGTVNLVDFAILAESCDPYAPPAITWVSISDPGAGMKDLFGNPISHAGFTGDMSKYETTNAQYCHYLNVALASGDIDVSGDYVVGTSGPYSGQNYYRLDGSGYTGYGATNGGASRIKWTGGSFKVDAGFENHPVTYISWYGATAFATYYGWRLPTEWEWQAVADYDGSYLYATGNSLYDSQKFLANYKANGHDGTDPDNLPYHPWVVHGTSEVGYLGAYGYGMADMAGNVWEWTDSIIHSSSYRVIRGGDWYYSRNNSAVSFRFGTNPEGMFSGGGFRVCRGEMQPDITWVSIDDDGSGMKDSDGNPISQGGFTGDMSKYETTNAQYCQFLNTALASGDIIVHTDNIVYAASDTSFLEPYFSTEAADSISQITYSNGIFSVRTRNGHSMADHPVVVVSWYGATAFADYYGWRLPTEWEWQAVADYDGSYTYGCGTTIDQTLANYNHANPLRLSSIPITSPVGYYSEYGYDMADMAGNVWEWTNSIYSDNSRVLRGGSWHGLDLCTVSVRGNLTPSNLFSRSGFRVCR